MYKTKFKFSEGDKETLPIPWDATLDPLATVIKWGTLGEEIEENEEMLLETWSEAPEQRIYGLRPFTDWEMHAVDIEEDGPGLLDFSYLYLKNSWYSSSEILDSEWSDLDTWAALSGKPCKE